jgi:hypothetical protein
MFWMTLTCGNCGHEAQIDEFTRTPVAGDLPHNVYQCPSCRHAIERRQGKPSVYPSGFVMPGPVTLVPVDSRF